MAAVIAQDDRLLVARRPAHARHGGLWEFPGGKCEPGETDEAAIARELREELGLRAVAVGPARFERLDPDSPYLLIFRDVTAAGIPVAHEHDALAWATPAELTEYPMAPGDAAFVAHLLATS